MNFIDELKEYLRSKTKEELLNDWGKSRIECDGTFTVQVINRFDSISDVSSRLEDSLGECSEDNKYEIVPYEGVFWINHQVVGSGEPLSQWVQSVINDC